MPSKLSHLCAILIIVGLGTFAPLAHAQSSGFPHLKPPVPADARPAAPTPDASAPDDAEPLAANTQDLALRHATALERYLTPRPLGFGTEIVSDTLSESQALLAWITEEAQRFWQARWSAKALMLLPLLILLLFAFGFGLLTRRVRRVRERLKAHIDRLPPGSLNSALSALARVIARALPTATLLVLAHFPLLGFYPHAIWLSLLILALWICLVVQLLSTTCAEVLLRERFLFSGHPTRLNAWFQRAIAMGAMLFFIWRALQILDTSLSLVAGAGFAFRLFIGLYSLRLLRLRKELDQLLPSFPDNTTYTAIRNAFSQRLHWIIAFSATFLLLWSIGFADAAKFILLRSYALIFLSLLGFWLYRRVHQALQQAIRRHESPSGAPTDTERHQVLKSLDASLTVGALLILIWGLLRILGLWPLLVDLTSLPLFRTASGPDISVFSIGRALFVVWLFVFISRAIRALLNDKFYPRFDVAVGVGYAINTMVHYFFLIIGALFGLKSFGLDLSNIAIFFSALGVGVGFGLQNTVNNLISGLIILFGRAVKKGDFVTAAGTFGRIDSVGARSVTIVTADNYELIVPSSEIISSPIVNWTLSSPIIRVTVPVGVSYGADPHQVKEVLLACAQRHPRIIAQPPPEVWLENFGDSSVDFALLVHVDCRTITERRLRGELNFIIWDALSAANIEIPFPQRDVHIRSADLSPLVKLLQENKAPASATALPAAKDGSSDDEAS